MTKKTPEISIQQIKARIAALDRKVLIQYGVGIGIFIAFIVFLFLPLLAQNKKLSVQTWSLEQRISKASGKIARIPEMKKQKETYGKRTEKVRAKFFEAKETEDLIKIISTAASEAKVKITASRPSVKPLEVPAQFATLYNAVSYDLIAEGSYHNLGLFVNKLETYQKNLMISHLEIVHDDKAQGGERCTFFLTAFLKRT